MANSSLMDRPVRRSRLNAALGGAGVTMLALLGGMVMGFALGATVFPLVEHSMREPLAIALAAFAANLGTLGGSALWGVGMARLAQVQAYRRAAWAGIGGFVPITIVVGLGLRAAEPLVFRSAVPMHRLFTLLFVPSAALVAGVASLALGWALGWGRAALPLALRVGLAAALAFLVVNLGMEALGWQVGGPRAAERNTMLTVLFVSSLGSAVGGGATLGLSLAQRR